MSNGKNPLMLMMALSMPGAANALGLGDIHVDSALNERLAAEIDIVGATALELTDLRASVANRDTFLRYGADRPAFLSSTTFKVTQDSQGRPVLAVRSTEAFTEPLVNFVVDLRWHNGELVREYTLLLDPTGFGSTNNTAANNTAAATAAADAAVSPSTPGAPDVPATPPASTPIVEMKTQTVARQLDPPSDQANPTAGERAARKTTHVKVGAKATLRGVAWRVGERSESDLQKMMIAIFRANPNAFDGNINRLHRGAVLTIPSREEVAAISKTDARREIHAQMTAWRSAARTPVTARTQVAAQTLVAAQTPAPASVEAAAEAAAPAAPATEELSHRVQSLEHELSKLNGVLESENAQVLGLQQQAARMEKTAPAVEAPRAQVKASHAAAAPVLGGLGILTAALTALYFKFRRRVPASKGSPAQGDATAASVMADTPVDGGQVQSPESTPEPAQELVRDSAPNSASDDDQADFGEATHPLLPVLSGAALAGRTEIGARAAPSPAPQDATVNMHVDTVNLRVSSTRLDYNLLDLDLTAQHVQMPSVLNEHAVVKERRTNLADVLRLAIEREPDRHDLRMKLLELYYSAAATNRRAFLEVVQKFAFDKNSIQSDEWDKIAFMGRQIAAENPMFAEESAEDDDLANCA